jgi:hypothetical protein
MMSLFLSIPVIHAASPSAAFLVWPIPRQKSSAPDLCLVIVTHIAIELRCRVIEVVVDFIVRFHLSFHNLISIGLVRECRLLSRRVRYDVGHVFVLVTDGVVEATDEHEGQFGFERLEQILCDSAERPLSEIFEAALAAVTESSRMTKHCCWFAHLRRGDDPRRDRCRLEEANT